MTAEEKLEILRRHFVDANSRWGNPGERGASPRNYATFVSRKIKEFVVIRPPTAITLSDAIQFANELERGDYDADIAALMGYG